MFVKKRKSLSLLIISNSIYEKTCVCENYTLLSIDTM